MNKHVCLTMVVVLGLLAGFAASAGKHAAASPHSSMPQEIKIDNFSFTPATVTVALGTTVTWTNSDDVPHTVVSEDYTFKSKVLDTDEKFSYKFTKPGTYSYFCSVHPKMTAKIIVQ